MHRRPEPRRPLLSLSAEERRSVAAAIEEVIAVLPPDTAVVCVTLAGRPPAYWYSPDAVLLARLGGGARRVVGPGDCPRTYDSMATIVDSTGRSLNPVRPPGYVDPHLVTLRAQRLVGADSAVANLDVYQGARVRIYRCHSHRESDGGWRAQCTKTGEAVSALPVRSSIVPRHIPSHRYAHSLHLSELRLQYLRGARSFHQPGLLRR